MRVETSDSVIELGATETTPTIGITDYSRRETDEFGVTTVVKRGFARRMSVRMKVPFADVDALQLALADLRATPALWVADDTIAALNVTGFYKEFSIDLAVPPVSFCTLTVEGLTEEDGFTDSGGDPATDGQQSTLRLLQPASITGSELIASSVAEADYALWDVGFTYALNARVIRTTTHRIYESLVGGNNAHTPETSPDKWLDVGPTNRWAMFDEALGTLTSDTGTIAVTLQVDGADALALLDVTAGTVRVQSTGYDQTVAAGTGAITFLDLPGDGAPIIVTISGPDQVSVGTLMIGTIVPLGRTAASPTAGITDYSRKDVDEFGDVTVVERGWAKRMAVNALIRTDAVDLVAGRIAAVRARPSLWIGDSDVDALMTYGFFKDFSISVGETVSTLSLAVEGLSTATRLAAAPVVTGLSGYLTNESHTLPADPAGAVTSYAGAAGDFLILNGASDVTAFFNFATAPGGNPQGLTVGYIGNTYSVSAGLDAGEDNASLMIRATGFGDFAGAVIDKVFSLAKSKTGATGAAAKGVTLTASAKTFRFDGTGTPIAQTITFAADRQNTSAAVAWTILDRTGSIVSGPASAAAVAAAGGYFTTSDNNHLSMTHTQFAAFIGGTPARESFTVLAEVTDGGTYADRESVTKVQDGAAGSAGTAAITPSLTNENHTLPADAAGNVLSYAGATGTFKVYAGTSDVSASFALSTKSGGNPQALTVGYVGQVYTVTAGLDAGEDNATLTIVAAGSGAYAGVTVEKTFTLAKSKTGTTGTDAKLINLVASSKTFRFDTAGAAIAGTVTFTATKQNTAAAISWSIIDSTGAVLIGPSTAATLGASAYFDCPGGDVITITHTQFAAFVAGAPTRETFSVLITATDVVALSDRESVSKIQDGAAGAPAVAGYLTNEAITLPADAAGNVLSYSGATGTFKVLAGATDVSSSFSLATKSGGNPQALTVGYVSQVYTVTAGFDAGEDTASLTIVATGSGAYAGASVEKTFTLAKSKTGAAGSSGTNAKLIDVTASARTFRFDSTGTAIAQTIDFNVTKQNTTATVYFTIIDKNGSIVLGPALASAYPATGYFNSSNANHLSMTHTQFTAFIGGIPARETFTVLVEATDVVALSDRESVLKVVDGATGNYRDTKFKRVMAQPATPTGDNPAGWSDGVPAGTDTLWQIVALKNAAGVLVDGWSTPQSISGVTPRGAYVSTDTYYRNNVATFGGGSYIATQDGFSGQAPTGTAQANAYWDVFAAPGAAGTPATPPSPFSATLNLTSGANVNLRSIADAASYTGQSNATITFNVPSGVTIRGLSGGAGIDTGAWPTGFTIALGLVVQSGGVVDGGGGDGGDGGSGFGMAGGDAIYCRVNLSNGITINAGGTVRGGGGGGGGGATSGTGKLGGGGGGGGAPTGAGGTGADGQVSTGNNGANGSTSGGGALGTPGGGAGGGYATAGANSSNGGGSGGAAGYAVRKNGRTVAVTNNGTMTGTAA